MDHQDFFGKKFLKLFYELAYYNFISTEYLIKARKKD